MDIYNSTRHKGGFIESPKQDKKNSVQEMRTQETHDQYSFITIPYNEF